MAPKVNEVKAKSIFIKSGLPGSDWVVNPYNGCLFGCMYCYAAQIARWKHPNEEWGTYLDPYNGLEAKYRLTRKCLEVLADFGYTGTISIQTKSPLVTQDVDILKRLKKATVGFTVTTLDDKVSRFLEVTAPPVSARIKALKELHDAGIKTYAFVGPILPHFTTDEEKISGVLDKLQEVGVREVWFEHINLSPAIKARLYDYLEKEAPGLIPDFNRADTQEYRDKLDKFIVKAVQDRKMQLGLGKVIYHKSLPKKK